MPKEHKSVVKSQVVYEFILINSKILDVVEIKVEFLVKTSFLKQMYNELQMESDHTLISKYIISNWM